MADARNIFRVSDGETAQFRIISCLLASDEPDHGAGTPIISDVANPQIFKPFS